MKSRIIIRTYSAAVKWTSVHEKPIQLVLENSAHGKKSLGGDVKIWHILKRFDYPEKAGFCFDTAHAYVFGYDIKEDIDLWLSEVLNDYRVNQLSLDI